MARKLLRPLLHDRNGSSRHLALVRVSAQEYLRFTGRGDRVGTKAGGFADVEVSSSRPTFTLQQGRTIVLETHVTYTRG